MDMGIIARILGQGGGPAYVNPLIDRGFANSGASHNRMLGRYGGTTPPNPTPRPQGILGRVMQQQGAPASPQPQQPTQPQPGGQGILGRMRGFMGDNRMALMGMGAGILNNGIAGGPGGAFQGSQLDYARGQDEMARNDAMAERDRETQDQTRRSEAMIQMAVQNGLSPEMAQQYEAAGLLDGYLEQALAPQGGGDPFTLSEGQVRYDAQGNEIARGPQDTQQAEEQRNATRALIAAEPAARSSIELAAQIAEHPGLRIATGPIEGRLPAVLNPRNYDPRQIPGLLQGESSRLENVEDFRALADTLGGRAFLEARRALRGGGSITDFEGQRAEQAIANMSMAQSAEQFQAALREFQESIATGMLLLANPDRPVTQADIDAYIAGTTGTQNGSPDAVQVPSAGDGNVVEVAPGVREWRP
jgi:hypothetical protein